MFRMQESHMTVGSVSTLSKEDFLWALDGVGV